MTTMLKIPLGIADRILSAALFPTLTVCLSGMVIGLLLGAFSIKNTWMETIFNIFAPIIYGVFIAIIILSYIINLLPGGFFSRVVKTCNESRGYFANIFLILLVLILIIAVFVIANSFDIRQNTNVRVTLIMSISALILFCVIFIYRHYTGKIETVTSDISKQNTDKSANIPENSQTGKHGHTTGGADGTPNASETDKSANETDYNKIDTGVILLGFIVVLFIIQIFAELFDSSFIAILSMIIMGLILIIIIMCTFIKFENKFLKQIGYIKSLRNKYVLIIGLVLVIIISLFIMSYLFSDKNLSLSSNSASVLMTILMLAVVYMYVRKYFVSKKSDIDDKMAKVERYLEILKKVKEETIDEFKKKCKVGNVDVDSASFDGNDNNTNSINTNGINISDIDVDDIIFANDYHSNIEHYNELKNTKDDMNCGNYVAKKKDGKIANEYINKTVFNKLHKRLKNENIKVNEIKNYIDEIEKGASLYQVREEYMNYGKNTGNNIDKIKQDYITVNKAENIGIEAENIKNLNRKFMGNEKIEKENYVTILRQIKSFEITNTENYDIQNYINDVKKIVYYCDVVGYKSKSTKNVLTSDDIILSNDNEALDTYDTCIKENNINLLKLIINTAVEKCKKNGCQYYNDLKNILSNKYLTNLSHNFGRFPYENNNNSSSYMDVIPTSIPERKKKNK